MRYIILIFLILIIPTDIRAQQDPIQINASLNVINITPYAKYYDRQMWDFALQNNSNASLEIILTRTRHAGFSAWQNVNATRIVSPLRLFDSDDIEYAPPLTHYDRIAFSMPPRAVKSFTFVNNTPEHNKVHMQIWLWSPNAHAKFEQRRTIVRIVQLGLFFLFVLIALPYMLWRRSMMASIVFTCAGLIAGAYIFIWYSDIALMLNLPPLNIIGLPQLIIVLIISALFLFVMAHIYGIYRSSVTRYWRKVLLLLDIIIVLASLGYGLNHYRGWILGPMTSDILESTWLILAYGLIVSIFFMPSHRRLTGRH